MNKYVKEFLHRGLMFGGFGPIITAVVMLILSYTTDDFSLTGNEMFLGVVSTYLLAFVHAGSSIFHQIEHWSVMKALFCQLGTLYIAYLICYIINSWLPFEVSIIAIFTIAFVVGYLVIWGVVYLCVKNTSKKMSKKLV